MGYPRYQEYIKSGVEWLGETPSTWTIKRVGYFFTERREKVSDKDFQPLSVTKNGIVPQLESAAKSDDGDNRKKVCIGDFVINSRSDRKGSSGASALDGSVSLINTVIVPNKNIDIKFAHNLFRSTAFQEEYYRYGKGIVADLWSTNYSEMKNISIPIPSLNEQSIIADFLESETAKIDNLVKEQEKLIELLKEKRQAVISHTVTKGLDPKVSLKDSGVEWLGVVPEHWTLGKLKYICEFAGGGTPSRENIEFWNGDIPWVSPKDMKVDFLETAEEKITQHGLMNSSTNLIEAGQVLMVVRSGILKHTIPVAINIIPVSMNQDMKALKFNDSVCRGEFFVRWVQGLNDLLLLEWAKQGATVESIEHDYLKETVIPLPPLEEQLQITEYLKKLISEYEGLVKSSEGSINLLQERRSALISAAVTGQIDVRNYQSKEIA
jgi:type I restriction enzyme S subunit